MNLKLHTPTNRPWFDDIAHSLEHFWDTPFTGKRDKSLSPACDFHETDDHYFFSFDVPGVRQEDLQLEIHDNTLHVSGKKTNFYEDKMPQDGKSFHERFYGQFKRSFVLPTAVKEDAVETHLKDGVLEILIPKSTASKGIKIPLKNTTKDGLFSRLIKPARGESKK